ncbi:MAG: hypothetical protein ACT4TC_24655 [Myxococcaceae bacterium]
MVQPGTFVALIQHEAAVSDLAAASDAMSHDAREKLVRSFSAKQLKTLYARGDGATDRASLDFFVPAGTPKGSTVEWIGQNSLPLFRAFTKRFTRSPQGDALIGHNTGATQGLVGPGYFTCVVHPERKSEFLFDYTRYPQATPNGWPMLARNERGISHLVFAGMHDYVRRIGSHMAIGAAYNSKGKFKGQYFVLSRGRTLPVGN